MLTTLCASIILIHFEKCISKLEYYMIIQYIMLIFNYVDIELC